MNEQPSMKLMFKGYQGAFPDKSFCKLRRRRKCENEQIAVTLPCLPVSFPVSYTHLDVYKRQLYGNWMAPITSVPGNLVQMGVGSVIVLVVIGPILKITRREGI